ncbi:MATE family efflux transporter [Bacillota bacterium Lsc_1132]
MKGTYNLTEDPITSTLMKLTWPIIATNFIQTTYGLVDMIWVGRLGSGPVAAIGTASFFVNLAAALFSMIAIGSGVKVAHSVGAGKEEEAKQYIHNGFLLSILLGMIYMAFILIAKNRLIAFFDLGDAKIEQMASQFLVISMIGTIFTFFNTLFSLVLNALGNSRKPFRVYMAGFLVNMALDPLLIFGAGGFNGLGVLGAALATLIANFLVSALFLLNTQNIALFTRPFLLNTAKMREVVKMGLPITVQRVTFIVISIIIAKIIVTWGAEAIAVQKVGIQIESISYMTIGGLQGAIAAFIGQNFGAAKFERIQQGYWKALTITILFGAVISVVFIVFPKSVFSLFLNDGSSLALGENYLRILGYSQLFMCLELMTVGAFNGIGKTYIPPIFSIVFTALRIPMALFLSGPFGLNGVWMAIAISSVLKGVVLVFWFLLSLRNLRSSFANVKLSTAEGR